jgi:hypothetical protein
LKKVQKKVQKKGQIKARQKGSNDSIAEYCILAEVQKKFKKKVQKKVVKKFEKKVCYKSSKILQIVRGKGGREGGEGGELSFQCLRPSTSLMAAGKKCQRYHPLAI